MRDVIKIECSLSLIGNNPGNLAGSHSLVTADCLGKWGFWRTCTGFHRSKSLKAVGMLSPSRPVPRAAAPAFSPGAVQRVQQVHAVLVLVWHSLSVWVSQRSGGMGRPPWRAETWLLLPVWKPSLVTRTDSLNTSPSAQTVERFQAKKGGRQTYICLRGKSPTTLIPFFP